MSEKESCNIKPVEDKCKKNCGKVISARTLSELDGKNIIPVGINGPLVAKIPVVLAEKKIQIDAEAVIKLEEPAYEIKRIKKSVFLTQCKLIPRSGECDDGVPTNAKLFLGGFVRKNIEYATVECVGEKVVSGDIRHTTVDIPFEGVTVVEYAVPPQIVARRNSKEIELYSDNVNCDCKCGQNVIGKFQCEQSFEDAMTYVERPYCELEEVKIFEEDIHKDLKPIDWDHKDSKSCDWDNYDDVKTFQEIIEKMVIYIKVKVLQVQQVNIPGRDC